MELDVLKILDETEGILRESKEITEANSTLDQVREKIIFLSGPVKKKLQDATAKLKERNDTENAKRADGLLSALFDESARLVTLGAQLMLSPKISVATTGGGGEEPKSPKHHTHHRHHHMHKGSMPKERLPDLSGVTQECSTRNRSLSSGKSNAPKPGVTEITITVPGGIATPPKVRSESHSHRGGSARFRDGKKVGSPLAFSMLGVGGALEEVPQGGPPDIPSAQIERCEEIGSGSYGTVYKGKVGGKWAAVKVPKRQSLSEEQMKDFLSEIQILKQITCQYVVQFFGACTEPGNLMIVSELMAYDLDSVIHKKDMFVRLPLAKKLYLAQDMAAGVNWLHTICNIVHRDLKPANFLLDDSMHAKVTDFGFSKALKGGRETILEPSSTKGSLLYMAPEVLRHEEYGKPADVYAYGLILYELLAEEEPFSAFEDSKSFIRAIKEEGCRQEVPDDLCTPEGEKVPRGLCELVRACTDPNQEARPTMGDVLTRLDAVTVEAITGDPGSPVYAFWVRNFVGPFQEEVPWPKVEAALSRLINVAPISLTKIKRLVVQQQQQQKKTKSAGSPSHAEYEAASSGSDSPLLRSPELVSLVMLNNAYLWLGDFFDPSSAQKVLFELGKIINAPWFHGDITQKEAEMRLNQRPEGAFLIRASKTSPRNYPFTLSKLRDGMPVHQRIGRLSYSYDAGERYVVQTHCGHFRCQTLLQIIDRLKELGEITTPCPKNIYFNIYAD